MKFSYSYSYKDPCENDFLERINEDEYEDLLLEQYADFLKTSSRIFLSIHSVS